MNQTKDSNRGLTFGCVLEDVVCAAILLGLGTLFVLVPFPGERGHSDSMDSPVQSAAPAHDHLSPVASVTEPPLERSFQ